MDADRTGAFAFIRVIRGKFVFVDRVCRENEISRVVLRMELRFDPWRSVKFVVDRFE